MHKHQEKASTLSQAGFGPALLGIAVLRCLLRQPVGQGSLRKSLSRWEEGDREALTFTEHPSHLAPRLRNKPSPQPHTKAILPNYRTEIQSA